MRFLKPSGSSFHTRSCRKTRIVFIPRPSAQPKFLVDLSGVEALTCHISSSLIASVGI